MLSCVSLTPRVFFLLIGSVLSALDLRKLPNAAPVNHFVSVHVQNVVGHVVHVVHRVHGDSRDFADNIRYVA